MDPKPTGPKCDPITHESTVDLPGRHITAGLLVRPERVQWLLALAHGAGAGMRHPFMESLAQALAQVEVATFRYEFPYMQDGRGRPDPPKVLTATVRAAIATAADVAPDLPLLAGASRWVGA